VFSFLRNRFGVAKFPAELRREVDGDDIVLIADDVVVVAHLRGHVPGVYSAWSATRFRGALALTTTRLLATLPTRADPELRARDSRWDLPGGPGRVTIDSQGVLLTIGLRGVDHAFSGSMTLHYKTTVSDDRLQRLPATQLWCTVDPILVYRAAGTRPPR
jgi:hypothetical protein